MAMCIRVRGTGANEEEEEEVLVVLGTKAPAIIVQHDEAKSAATAVIRTIVVVGE